MPDDLVLFDNATAPVQIKPRAPIAPLALKDFTPGEDGVPRIIDWRIGEVLGFEQESQLRRLIVRHRERLEALGTFFHRERKSVGGRPGHEYHLNFEQAIFIVVKSDAQNADAVTLHVIGIYGMWARGELVPRDAMAEVKVADSIANLAEIAPAMAEALLGIKRLDALVDRFEEQIGRGISKDDLRRAIDEMRTELHAAQSDQGRVLGRVEGTVNRIDARTHRNISVTNGVQMDLWRALKVDPDFIEKYHQENEHAAPTASGRRRIVEPREPFKPPQPKPTTTGEE